MTSLRVSMRISLRKIAVAAGVAMMAGAGGAHAQGQLNIICSVPIPWCEALVAQFQRDSGIKVGMTQKGSGESMAQVAAEMRLENRRAAVHRFAEDGLGFVDLTTHVRVLRALTGKKIN